MADRIMRKSYAQSAQSKYNMVVPNISGNDNKTSYNSQKNYPNQNLPHDNKNIFIIEQNYSTENDSTFKNLDEKAIYGTQSSQSQRINKNGQGNKISFNLPYHTNPKTKQVSTQQKSAKAKDLVDSHDLLKYFQNGKIAQLNRALINLKTDTNFYTRRYYNIEDWKGKQLDQRKALRRVNSGPQYSGLSVPPMLEKMPQTPTAQTPPCQTDSRTTFSKMIDKNPTENFCEQKLKKKDQLVEKLKILQQNLNQTILLLSSENKGNRELAKVGKISRLQTIVNAKLQVDVKELLKIARQMM